MRRIPIWMWMVGAGACGYAFFLASYFSPVAAGSDSGGYYFSARLITEGRLASEVRTVEEAGEGHVRDFVPLGTIGDEQGSALRPTYPVGLPALYAAAAVFLGWHWGPLVIGVAAALGAAGLCHGILRECGASTPLAVSGAVALAASPLFIFMSIGPLSDGVATFWTSLVMYAALRSRSRPGWALVCGAALGMAVLVRPSSLVMIMAPVIVLGTWRRLGLAFIGGLPFALFLAWYQHAQYGSPWISGYGGIFDLFSPREVPPSLRHYAVWLVPLVPVAVAAPLVGRRDWRRHPREIAGLALWFLSFAVFYAFYPVTHQTWWSLRFLLPAFPALVVLGLLALRGGFGRLGICRYDADSRIAAIGVAIVSIAAGVVVGRHHGVFGFDDGLREYRDTTTWVRNHVPEDAVLVAMVMGPSLYFYTGHPVVRWDQMPAERFDRMLAGVRKTRRPVFAVLYPFEEEDPRWEALGGVWEQVARVHDFVIWRLDLEAPPAERGRPLRASP